MPHIASIAYTPAGVERRPEERYARVAIDAATLVARRGIEGDQKATRGKRQLNVMLAETVAELRAEGFSTAPGELGEQLVIAGLAEAPLGPGVQLRLGETAVIELDELRTGCKRFQRIQGRPPAAVTGRLGYMAHVVEGGAIAVGDEAVAIGAAAASEPSG